MDIRKEDISKMRLRVGICNNEIINAQTELVISHIKKVHKDVSFTKFDIGGGRHFNTSGIAGVPENVLCNTVRPRAAASALPKSGFHCR